jgi:hypothetical protein
MWVIGIARRFNRSLADERPTAGAVSRGINRALRRLGRIFRTAPQLGRRLSAKRITAFLLR